MAPGGTFKEGLFSKSVGIYSTVFDYDKGADGSGYDYKSGTSMAAPHITGLAALIKEAQPYLSWPKVRQAILDGASEDYKIPSDQNTKCDYIYDMNAGLLKNVELPQIPVADACKAMLKAIHLSNGTLPQSTFSGIAIIEGEVNILDQNSQPFTQQTLENYDLTLDIKFKAPYSGKFYVPEVYVETPASKATFTAIVFSDNTTSLFKPGLTFILSPKADHTLQNPINYFSFPKVITVASSEEIFSQDISFIPDPEAPKIKLFEIKDETLEENVEQAIINYEATDNYALERAELWRTTDDNGKPDSTNWTMVKSEDISGENYGGSLTDDALPAGIFWYGIHIVDTACNWATESNPIQVCVYNNTTNADNDDYLDIDDAFPLDPSEWADFDVDGTGDNADPDDDNDGINDDVDAFPNDSYESVDADGDGVGDNSDNCPEIANSDQADSDNDGIGDACENNSDPDFVVNFPDPNLESVIREAINKPEGEIWCSELQNLTCLDALNRGIIDLNGLQYCANLIAIQLSSYINVPGPENQITDISPLAGLTSLSLLSLDGNLISDISSLSELTKLRSLSLCSNPISDLTPIAGLTSLTSLYLHGNQISDLTLLAGLASLNHLSLWDNQISDLTPIAGLTSLTSLYLYGNQISDLTPLAGLTSLSSLDLGKNQISDLTSLAGLTSLTWLYLYGNQISDLTPLAGLTDLNLLFLQFNQISDLTPLVGLTSLEGLRLESNQISDLTPLIELANLYTLYIIYIDDNPLSPNSCFNIIPQLEAQGVTIIGEYPNDLSPFVQSESGEWGDTITQLGFGFCPNGQAELHFKHLSGTEETAIENIDSNGNYEHYYTIPEGKPTGTWYYWAVDLATGISSEQVSYIISSPNTTISPYVTVSPSTGYKSAGTILNEPGYGFTPNSPVTLHFIDPNGNPTTITKTTDSNGDYQHSYTCHSGSAEGEWEYYAVDKSTGIQTASVFITINP